MKRQNDCFSTYHPFVNFLYFAVVLVVTMFMLHPYFLAIGFSASLTYSIYLNRSGAVKFNLIGMLPLFILMVVGNPLFNHAGVTILFYVHGNPWTLEAIVYGFAAATMFIAIINWFACYNAVMTSDKFIFLFGKVIPRLSLVLSMILRFVPKYKAQIKKISTAQRCIGRDISNGNLRQKMRNGVKILSMMMTWALEDGIETADSMESRGYGLPGRTSFAIFRFDKRDRGMLFLISLLGIFVFTAIGTGQIFVLYYPAIQMNADTVLAIVAYFAYGVLCYLPFLIGIAADLNWRRLQRSISETKIQPVKLRREHELL